MNLRDEEKTGIFLNELENFFENIDKELKQIELEIQNKELERDDLLHEIELANLNAIELSSTSRRLRKCLQERRLLKNHREYIHTLKGFSDKFITKGIIADSKQLIKNVENLNRSRVERKYNPRILKDLKVGKLKREGVNR